jgi:DNA invertase Pin-like site-specific DNA recombinase
VGLIEVTEDNRRPERSGADRVMRARRPRTYRRAPHLSANERIRTQAGLERAKQEGKTLGRPSSLSEAQQEAVAEKLRQGASVAGLAKEFQTSRQTIMRVRDAMKAEETKTA